MVLLSEYMTMHNRVFRAKTIALSLQSVAISMQREENHEKGDTEITKKGGGKKGKESGKQK